MELYSSYSIKIKHYNSIFLQSVDLYRKAVDYFIQVCLQEWDSLKQIKDVKTVNAVEALTIKTKNRLEVKYDFSKKFYKFPSYLRRNAIAEAIGKTSSYMSNLENYNKGTATGRPGLPRAGKIYPVLYKGNCFVREDDYTAKIKVYMRNTWDWLTVSLRKSDADYIIRHCSKAEECSPALQSGEKNGFWLFLLKKKQNWRRKRLWNRLRLQSI